MRDLQQSVPPQEFRELDLSTGVPRPRPVDIMLGDMRPQPYPAELVARTNAAMQAQKAPPPKKSSFAAFSGAGQTLGGTASDAASPAQSGEPSASAAPSGGGASADGGAWSDRPPPTVDESAPTTEVQVRLASGGPQKFRLNRSHTVADLKTLVEAALAAAGVAPRAYVLAAGFPPKPLADEAATLDAAGLAGAAVTQRWA
jgi:UBX domain-containing protein 1